MIVMFCTFSHCWNLLEEVTRRKFHKKRKFTDKLLEEKKNLGAIETNKQLFGLDDKCSESFQFRKNGIKETDFDMKHEKHKEPFSNIIRRNFHFLKHCE